MTGTMARQAGEYDDEAAPRARAACAALTSWAKAGFAAGLFGAANASKVSRLRLPSTHVLKAGFDLLEKPGENLDKEELEARISFMENLLAAILDIQNEAVDVRHRRVMAGICSLGGLSAAWLACIISAQLVADSTALVAAAGGTVLLWAIPAVLSIRWERRKFDAIQGRIEPEVFLPWMSKPA